MRLLEITLAALLAIRIIFPFRQHIRWKDALSLLILGIMQIQIFIEGYRWQLIPLYGLALGATVILLRNRTTPKSKPKSASTRNLFVIFGGLGLLAIAILPPILLPVPTTPAPTGPYQVGTTTLMLVDENREETYSDQENEPRQIMVQFWYPAEPVRGQKTAPWMENMEVMGPAISNYLGFPDFFLDHIEYSRAHAYAKTPILQAVGPYPLILFSHGWNGFRAQNTFQVEELASHGYIVAAPDHTYGSVATVFPDGTAALNNRMALPSGMGLPEVEFMVAARLLGQQWAGDLSFIVDYLAGNQRSADEGLLVGQLVSWIDFEKIGVMGHSTGGGAAIQFCGTDPRCQTVLGMDPYLDPVSPEILDAGVESPILVMFSEVWENRRGDNMIMYDQFSTHIASPHYRFYLTNTAHFDFSDLPAFSPLAAKFGLKGTINGERALRIVNDYTLAFFDLYLKGHTNTLLDGPNLSYPEIIWADK